MARQKEARKKTISEDKILFSRVLGYKLKK